MRIWNRLKIWVEEEANAVQMYQRLSEAAEMYQLGKTGLWRPPDLQLAVNWRERKKPTLAWAERYNPAFERAMVYLSTSEKEFKAEEENKIKLQKRTLRRTRMFAIVLGSAAIIAIGLTVYSQMLKVEADKQRKEADHPPLVLVRRGNLDQRVGQDLLDELARAGPKEQRETGQHPARSRKPEQEHGKDQPERQAQHDYDDVQDCREQLAVEQQRQRRQEHGEDVDHDIRPKRSLHLRSAPDI